MLSCHCRVKVLGNTFRCGYVTQIFIDASSLEQPCGLSPRFMHYRQLHTSVREGGLHARS